MNEMEKRTKGKRREQVKKKRANKKKKNTETKMSTRLENKAASDGVKSQMMGSLRNQVHIMGI